MNEVWILESSVHPGNSDVFACLDTAVDYFIDLARPWFYKDSKDNDADEDFQNLHDDIYQWADEVQNGITTNFCFCASIRFNSKDDDYIDIVLYRKEIIE